MKLSDSIGVFGSLLEAQGQRAEFVLSHPNGTENERRYRMILSVRQLIEFAHSLWATLVLGKIHPPENDDVARERALESEAKNAIFAEYEIRCGTRLNGPFLYFHPGKTVRFGSFVLRPIGRPDERAQTPGEIHLDDLYVWENAKPSSVLAMNHRDLLAFSAMIECDFVGPIYHSMECAGREDVALNSDYPWTMWIWRCLGDMYSLKRLKAFQQRNACLVSNATEPSPDNSELYRALLAECRKETRSALGTLRSELDELGAQLERKQSALDAIEQRAETRKSALDTEAATIRKEREQLDADRRAFEELRTEHHSTVTAFERELEQAALVPKLREELHEAAETISRLRSQLDAKRK